MYPPQEVAVAWKLLVELEVVAYEVEVKLCPLPTMLRRMNGNDDVACRRKSWVDMTALSGQRMRSMLNPL